MEGRMGRRANKKPPAVLVEWQAATQAYVDAKEADQPLGSAQARVKKAWLAIKDEPGFTPSPFAIELMEEVMRPVA
jgi:hypothetical protein